MRKIFISDLDDEAPKSTIMAGAGLETVSFCTAETMEDERARTRARDALTPYPYRAVHAPYFELTPCAIDSRVGEVSRLRYRQAVDTCLELGAQRLIVHSGFLPFVYYPEWFVPKSIDFWRDFMRREMPAQGLTLCLENVLDTKSMYVREICDAVDDPRFGLCLDIGHARVYSEESPEQWIESLGRRIFHVHMHNNDGFTDSHRGPVDGVIDVDRVLTLLDRYAPEAALCIESTYSRDWTEYLKRKGYM